MNTVEKEALLSLSSKRLGGFSFVRLLCLGMSTFRSKGFRLAEIFAMLGSANMLGRRAVEQGTFLYDPSLFKGSLHDNFDFYCELATWRGWLRRNPVKDAVGNRYRPPAAAS